MLQIQNLSYTYPGGSSPVISMLNLDMNPGGIYGLLGANGTGKSTLLYLISGLLKPQHGTVEFDGCNTMLRLPHSLSDIFLVAEEFEVPAIMLEEFCAA